MIPIKEIEKITQALLDCLPPGLRQLPDELKNRFQAILTAQLHKLNLVSQEEFDVQKAVLARTRAKLDALEKQVAALESAKAKPKAKKKTAPKTKK